MGHGLERDAIGTGSPKPPQTPADLIYFPSARGLMPILPQFTAFISTFTCLALPHLLAVRHPSTPLFRSDHLFSVGAGIISHSSRLRCCLHLHLHLPCCVFSSRQELFHSAISLT
ncbi:hypothetical protein J6590_001879 [Homalodisca vitripennis]|nr:hypothetical protein J6590_001879 [Homalodisca vitripennis]